MSKVKAKVKSINKVVGESGINGLFEEMMGLKDAEPDIIIPKFVLVRNTLRQVYRVLTQFSSFVGLREVFPYIMPDLDEVKKFAEDMKESVYLKHDHDEDETIYAKLSKEAINNLYRKLKENQYVRALVVLCNKLDKYHRNFADTNNIKENFVNQEPGLSFMMFDFSSLDFKKLWAQPGMKSSVKKYILAVFSSLYKHTYNIYRTINSPDVDIDKFTELLMSSISELKKQPKLNRCQAAFKRIEQSVELLKDKFSDYYRESISTGNENALISSFIVDVSNQGGADARLTREFRIIIQYMHEMSEKTGKNKDPNVQKIMKMLNDNHSLMERHTGVASSARKASDSVDSNDLSQLNLTMKNNNLQPTQEEIAEEKKTKRLEKQRAKAKKKRVRSKEQKAKLKAQELSDDEETAEDATVCEALEETVDATADNVVEEQDQNSEEQSAVQRSFYVTARKIPVWQHEQADEQADEQNENTEDLIMDHLKTE